MLEGRAYKSNSGMEPFMYFQLCHNYCYNCIVAIVVTVVTIVLLQLLQNCYNCIATIVVTIVLLQSIVTITLVY